MANLEPLSVDPNAFLEQTPNSKGCANQPNGGPLVVADPASVAVSTKGFADLSKRWPNGSTLHVFFLNGTDAWGQQVRQAIRETAVQWSDYANIKFRFDQPTAHITVNLIPVTGIANNGTYNCWHGIDCIAQIPLGKPSMNLVFDPRWQNNPPAMREEFNRVILHEFGHSLGMVHEHMRPDRQLVWNVSRTLQEYAEVGWGPDMVQSQVFNFYQGGPTWASAFDPHSIMMYKFPPGLARFSDGTPFEAPNNTTLSPQDKVLANMLYPKLGVIDPDEVPLAAGAAATSGAIQSAGQVARYRFHPPAPGKYSIETQGTEPLLLSLLTKRNDPAGKMTAVEGPNAKIALTAAGAVPDYFVEVRHAKPMSGTGTFTISVRQQ